MRLLTVFALTLLAGCMAPSELAREGRYYLGDAGVLSHHQVQRSMNMRLQQDAQLYLAQSHFPPVDLKPHRVEPNILAKEAFKGFVEYFPRVRRSDMPLGLSEAMGAAKAEQADYLVYLRLAQASDGQLVDQAVVQLMLYETAGGQLVDAVRLPLRSGVFEAYNNRPEGFLRRPMQDYARRLLGLKP